MLMGKCFQSVLGRNAVSLLEQLRRARTFVTYITFVLCFNAHHLRIPYLLMGMFDLNQCCHARKGIGHALQAGGNKQALVV
jgi:hypothetical protein